MTGRVIAAILAGLAVAVFVPVVVVSDAGAVPNPAGYAQAARSALARSAAGAGYVVACWAQVTDWATQQVRVSCLLSHPGPPRWRGQLDQP